MDGIYAALEPADMETRGAEVHLRAFQADELHAKPWR